MTKREREGGEKSGWCFFLKRFRAIKREVEFIEFIFKVVEGRKIEVGG